MDFNFSLGLKHLLINEYGLLDPNIEYSNEGSDNNTYIVTDNNRKYVAKIYEDRRRADGIASFMQYLYKSSMPIPAIITTHANTECTSIGNRIIVLCEFMSGNSIGWASTFASLSGELTTDIATIIAKMHLVALKMPLQLKIDHDLSLDQVFRKLELNELSKFLLEAPVLEDIRMAMIHGDLTRENILLSPSKNTVSGIIDFGDAHFDYITYDIAILLTQVYVTKTWGIDFQGIQEFLSAYTKHNPLQRNELKTIFPFMVIRNLALLQEAERLLTNQNADIEALKSIKQSVQVKLELLKQHHGPLETMILAN